MIWQRGLFFVVLALGAGSANQAFASILSTGTLTYNFSGFTADATCSTAPIGMQRENFTGVVTDAGQSISGAALTFSICNNPGSFDGGIFSVTAGLSIVSGTITATDLGDIISGGVDNETVAGSFLVTSGTGTFAGSEGYSDVFLATISENISTGAGTGSFIVGAPEPSTKAITGFGVFIGLLYLGCRVKIARPTEWDQSPWDWTVVRK